MADPAQELEKAVEAGQGDGTEGWFFPQKSPDDYPSANQLLITCRDGAVLQCWQSRAAKPGERTFLYFHGNGELVARTVEGSAFREIPNRIDLFLYLAEQTDLRLVLMEYRGYGNTAALGPPNLTKVLNDAEDVYRSLQVADERIVIMGRSLGTIPAVHLAGTFPNLGTLILESGMLDPLEGVSKRHQDVTLRSDISERLAAHHANLRKFQGTLLQLHADNDRVFPGQQALALFKVATAASTPKEQEEEEAKGIELGEGSSSSGSSDSSSGDGGGSGGNSVLEVPRATLYQKGRVSLVMFAGGDHNYIWDLNWVLYSQAVSKALLGEREQEAQGKWYNNKDKEEAKPAKKEKKGCTIH